MRKYFLFLLLAIPLVGVAQQSGQVKLNPPAPGLGTDQDSFIKFLITLAQWFVTPAIVLVMLYAGFEMATAKGDPKKIDSGKKRLLGAVIGAAVLFGSTLVIDVVKNTGKAILGE